ncbi:hypothetical protein K9M79_05565 [Candidatus Woesearchaeota archaeon]|nr:hypothetical protein [Candidatus Woesearchaeota archaeon]
MIKKEGPGLQKYLPVQLLVSYSYLSLIVYFGLLILSAVYFIPIGMIAEAFVIGLCSIVFIFVNIKIIKGIINYDRNVWNIIIIWYMITTIFTSLIYIRIGEISNSMMFNLSSLIFISINMAIMIFIIINKSRFELHAVKTHKSPFPIIVVASLIILTILWTLANNYTTSVRQYLDELKGKSVNEAFLVCVMKESQQRDICLTSLSVSRSTHSGFSDVHNPDMDLCQYVTDEFMKFTCYRGSA